MEPTARLVHDIDQYRAWQRETIRTFGWAIEAVLAEDDDPAFAHTVGLSGYGHPELIIFATDPDVAGVVLNALGETVRAGQVLHAGTEVVLPGVGTVGLLDFPRSEDWLLAAEELYRLPGRPPVPALLVLPGDGIPIGDDGSDGEPPERPAGSRCPMCG